MSRNQTIENKVKNRRRRGQRLDEPGSQNTNSNEGGSIIYLNTGEEDIEIHGITPDTTIGEVIQKFRQKKANTRSNSKYTLISGEKELVDPEKTFKDYGINKIISNTTFTISVQAQGGTKLENDEKNYVSEGERDHLFPDEDEINGVKITEGKDCVMNDIVEDVAKMNCGCLISAPSLYFHIKYSVKINDTCTEIKCPVENCGKLWDWNTCLYLADHTKKEILYLNKIRNNRIMKKKGLRTCPHCKMWCKRPDDLTKKRIACKNCYKGDWCFVCSKPWINPKGGFVFCGNTSCSVYSVQERLDKKEFVETENNSKWVKGEGYDKIPKYRACPGCHGLIKHMEACKHMTCPYCPTSFCYICLGICDKEKGWPCGSYSDKCPIADVQKLF